MPGIRDSIEALHQKRHFAVAPDRSRDKAAQAAMQRTNSITQRVLRLARGWLLLLLIVLPGMLPVADDIRLDEETIRYYEDKYGSSAAERLREWQNFMHSDDTRNKPIGEKLQAVNDFFNRMRFIDDIRHWGEMDYWATPVEFLATNGGDCEDFAIAKYLTLKQLGVPTENMRITYVKALEINQAHMVLTFYETPSSEPVVLDNLKPTVLPASQRDDLVPVYSFNGDNLWLSKNLRGRGQLVGGAERIKRWKELQQRMSTH
jgi:predicted transglutaminase-like cysteine proteinase